MNKESERERERDSEKGVGANVYSVLIGALWLPQRLIGTEQKVKSNFGFIFSVEISTSANPLLKTSHAIQGRTQLFFTSLLLRRFLQSTRRTLNHRQGTISDRKCCCSKKKKKKLAKCVTVHKR